jgi:hypothetical protein
VFIVYASVCERNARFPANISDVRICFSLFFLPSLHTHIVELVLAIFALSLGRHISGSRKLSGKTRAGLE